MEASPYYASIGRGNESETKTYGPDGKIDRLPLYYDNYFVPRGYASVSVDLVGTNRSLGCNDLGGLSDVQCSTACAATVARPQATSRRSGPSVTIGPPRHGYGPACSWSTA